MKAALVRMFDIAPRCEDVAAPAPADPNDIIVDVIAAGLHPRVRSQANGTHYTSTDKLPLIPGIDGVGRGPDGLLRYFVLPDGNLGSMAESTVIDPRRSIVVPDSSDAVALAAAMNPAMSSWVALRSRVQFSTGQQVLILGATGNAGRLAVQVAKLLGAGRVVAAGRDAGRLAATTALGATDTVVLDGSQTLARVAADVDIVLDYLWGEPTSDAMAAMVRRRREPSKTLTWIQLGSVAGPSAAIPAAALRAARLQIVGSGQGSVDTAQIVAELPALAARINEGAFEVDARTVPLDDIEHAWTAAAGSAARTVVVPHQSW